MVPLRVFTLGQVVAVVLIETDRGRALFGFHVLKLGYGVDNAFDASAAHAVRTCPVGIDFADEGEGCAIDVRHANEGGIAGGALADGAIKFVLLFHRPSISALFGVSSEPIPESYHRANLLQADLAEAVLPEFRLDLVFISGNDYTRFRILLWDVRSRLVSKNGDALACGRRSLPFGQCVIVARDG